MNIIFKAVLALFSLSILSACTVLGLSSVEVAPYEVLEKDNAFELRHYDQLILVSTPMESMEEQRSPFRRLFNYITGDNEESREIPMTAPVFLGQDQGKTNTMSFVLPADYSMENSPLPMNAAITLEELTDYTVASITFSGFLSEENIAEYKTVLDQWIGKNGYQVTGHARAAGYNPPFTLPPLRRNEILIPVKKP